MKIDQAGLLQQSEAGDPVILRFPSSRSSNFDFVTGGKPKGIVWHWTTGRCTTERHANALAESIRGYKKGDVMASWHVLIAKDGRVLQSIPFDRGSWHVGRPGTIDGRLYANVNRCTVGVELENSGPLLAHQGEYYCWPYYARETEIDGTPRWEKNFTVPAERAVLKGAEYFDAYPAAQVESARRLLKALVIKFGWGREVCSYFHSTFDSPRKRDPGPVWAEDILPPMLDGLFGP